MDNPINYVDFSGNMFISILLGFLAGFLVATTINDICQIADPNKVTISINDRDVEITDSYKILTPWVQLAFSIYLNHFNPDTKDIIKGSSVGMQYEWFLHNVAYYLGIERDKTANVNLGTSIFADSHGGLMGNAMKISYILLSGIVYWIWDLIANGGYGKW